MRLPGVAGWAASVAVLVFFALAGCARLPSTVSIPASERQVVEASFNDWRAAQLRCPDALDAEAAVTFKSWVQSGTVSGYLQAMEPAYLKFIALNPFGQPMLALVTDGERFRYVSVPETRSYEGSVQAKSFEKYAPDGAQPSHAFYWLSGRLPSEEFRITQIARDEKEAAYWIELWQPPSRVRHRILYDPRRQVLNRHLVVDGEEILVDVRYEDYQSGEGASCPQPGLVTIEARGHRGKMILNLSDWLADPQLYPGDFQFEVPAGYERIMVQ